MISQLQKKFQTTFVILIFPSLHGYPLSIWIVMHPVYNRQKVHNVQATARQRAKKKKVGVWPYWPVLLFTVTLTINGCQLAAPLAEMRACHHWEIHDMITLPTLEASFAFPLSRFLCLHRSWWQQYSVNEGSLQNFWLQLILGSALCGQPTKLEIYFISTRVKNEIVITFIIITKT